VPSDHRAALPSTPLGPGGPKPADANESHRRRPGAEMSKLTMRPAWKMPLYTALRDGYEPAPAGFITRRPYYTWVVTSRRSRLRLLRPDDGRIALCGRIARQGKDIYRSVLGP
jgi:hypothetical protein